MFSSRTSSSVAFAFILLNKLYVVAPGVCSVAAIPFCFRKYLVCVNDTSDESFNELLLSIFMSLSEQKIHSTGALDGGRPATNATTFVSVRYFYELVLSLMTVISCQYSSQPMSLLISFSNM